MANSSVSSPISINLDGKIFRTVANSKNGEVSGETRFYYHQKGSVVTATYSGGSVIHGHLIAIIDNFYRLNMRYHHVNTAGEIMIGTCESIPEILFDGRLQYHETWQWLSGDKSTGNSIIEEIFCD